MSFFENVSDCHFETFGYISCLVSGNTLLASDFFCEKATIDFRRMLCEVSSVCHLQTQWNGDGCHFSRFHSLYTNIERKGTKECKQKREGISSGKQKNQSQFCLGYLAQDSRNPNKTVTTIRCDVSKYEIRVLMTKQYTTLVVRKKRVALRHCINAKLVTKGCVQCGRRLLFILD